MSPFLAINFFQLLERGWYVLLRDIDWYLAQPLDVSLIQRAMLASIMVGIVSGIVGSLVVVRGMSFFGDALAHAILPGVAFMFQKQQSGDLPANTIGEKPLFWGGLGAGIFSALLIGFLTRNDRLRNDTAIGVVFAGMFALGIAMISRIEGYAGDLSHILFGQILGVSQADLTLTVVFSLIVIAIVAIFYKEFMIISFDPILAKTLRLPTEFLRYLLLVLISVSIVVSLQIVGVALMVALLVTPAATASLLTHRLHWMMLTAGLLGALSSVIGFYVSYHLDVATGAAIVLTATVIFLGVFLYQSATRYLKMTSHWLQRKTNGI